MKSFTVNQALALGFFSCITLGGTSSTWTVNCNPLVQYRADPILSPGAASGHVHSIVGGTAFQRNMQDNNTSVNSRNTTCDKYTDHSNYWAPSLYYAPGNGQLKLLKFQGAAMYYSNYTCDYNASTPGQCPPIRQARAFPPGFRMIGGNSVRRTYNSSDQTNIAISFTGGGQNNVHALPAITNTGSYEQLRGQVDYPSCWNGRDVWLPNSAHVSYPDPRWGNTAGGMCPPDFPLALVHIGGEYFWEVTGVNVNNGSQLVFANGDTTGYGFHADFLQGWTNSTALQQSFANCFTNDNCPWRSFGNPAGTDYSPHNFDPEVAPIYEQPIGLQGPITTLPGPTNTTNCVYNCTIAQPYCC